MVGLPNEVKTHMVGLLCCSLKTPDYCVPSVILYLACDCDAKVYNLVTALLSCAELAVVTENTITLTPRGVELATELDAVRKELLAKKKAEEKAETYPAPSVN